MLIKELFMDPQERALRIQGWLRTLRSGKEYSFLTINDGSHPLNLQVVIPSSSLSPTLKADLNLGTTLEVSGHLILTPNAPQPFELHAEDIRILGPVTEQYPLQKKEISFEYLRQHAHFRPRTATFSSIFRVRSGVCQALFEYFFENYFSYIHAPILTQSDAEGAGETFFVCAQDPRQKDFDFSKDFFESPTLLAVTGQLEAEIMAAGLNRVFTFAPIFRAENSNTSRHLAEFWMLEPEMAFFDLTQTIDLAEDLMKSTTKRVLNRHIEDFQILKAKSSRPIPNLETIEESFQRLTYADAVEILMKENNRFEMKVSQGSSLASEHERFLTDVYFEKPVFITHFPSEQKAFYAYDLEDGTSASFDLLMPGIGEVIGGTQREHRYNILERKMNAKQKETLKWYLDLRREGTFVHSGFGLGLERYLSWLTGFGNVRDLIPFPRTPGQCLF